MVWLFLISLSLPGAWLLARLVDDQQRSKYIVSLLYLFLSWIMVVATFTTFIAVWENQMSVRAFLAEETARLPLWVRVSYDFFDRFSKLFSATDLAQGVIYSLPALLIPLARLGHFRSKSVDALAFRYAAFNVVYFWLAEIVTNHQLGSEQIMGTYVRLGGYALLLLAHWFARPTAVWTTKIWSTAEHTVTPKATNG